ncbi:MAG: 2-amino-4-hydroxy-6-hydroxymethyldihydropteridine diphosphokinase, partial [Sphingobacteriales bacterium]
MNNAFLLIGGNMGNVSQNLDKAIRSISQTCGKIIMVSSVYQTAAWGKTDQPDFLNQAIHIN